MITKKVWGALILSLLVLGANAEIIDGPKYWEKCQVKVVVIERKRAHKTLTRELVF